MSKQCMQRLIGDILVGAGCFSHDDAFSNGSHPICRQPKRWASIVY